MDATTQELLKKRKRKEKRAELFPMHIRIIKKLEIFLTFLKDNKNFERKKSKRKQNLLRKEKKKKKKRKITYIIPLDEFGTFN